MTIHPKYINRRKPDQTYIFEHRSNEFGGRICGVHFKAGISAPAKMAVALRIAGAMGAKMLKVHCVETGETWGDREPPAPREVRPRELSVRVRELVARAVACGVTDESHVEGLVKRVCEELNEPDVNVEESLAAMAVDLDAHEARAAAKLEATQERIGVTPPQNDTPAMRAWLEEHATSNGWTQLRWVDGVDDYGANMGSLYGTRGEPPAATEPAPPDEDALTDEDEGPDGSDEDEPAFADDEAPMSTEPFHISRAELEAKGTKVQLVEWASENLGLLLDVRETREKLLDAILAHALVIETPSAAEAASAEV